MDWDRFSTEACGGAAVHHVFQNRALLNQTAMTFLLRRTSDSVFFGYHGKSSYSLTKSASGHSFEEQSGWRRTSTSSVRTEYQDSGPKSTTPLQLSHMVLPQRCFRISPIKSTSAAIDASAEKIARTVNRIATKINATPQWLPVICQPFLLMVHALLIRFWTQSKPSPQFIQQTEAMKSGPYNGCK